MSKYLVLPKIGMNMEDAVIVKWLIKPGDKVEKEQMVVEAETDKAVQELFATDSGIVAKLLVQPGDEVKCQEKIAVLVEEGESYIENEEAAATTPKEAPPPTPTVASTAADQSAAKVSGGNRVRISPLARKQAAENGIDLSVLRPKEEGKRIVSADVKRYLESKTVSVTEAPADAKDIIPYSRMRQIVARNMRESAANKPRVTLYTTVDCTNLIALREELKKTRKVTYNEIIAKICAAALEKNPQLNCTAEDDGYHISWNYNIGIAVDTQYGLKVPVLKNVERKGILQLAEEFAALVDGAKSNSLRMDDICGGTFTISNLGMYAVEAFDPIINGRECFILGVAAMKDTVVPVNGEIVIRKCMQLSLAFDHAAFDGAQSAKLLTEIKRLLENPILLLA